MHYSPFPIFTKSAHASHYRILGEPQEIYQGELLRGDESINRMNERYILNGHKSPGCMVRTKYLIQRHGEA